MKKIALWAIPRAVGTAFERTLLERGDTEIAHEFFMPCHYYSKNRQNNRYDNQIIANESYDYSNVICKLNSLCTKQILLVKEIAFHMTNIFDDQFWSHYTHSFIIRDPRLSLPSLHSLMPDFTFLEAGFTEIHTIFNIVINEYNQRPIVVNGETFQKNPVGVLKKYCEYVDIPFIDSTKWSSNSVLSEWQEWPNWHKEALSNPSVQSYIRKKRKKTPLRVKEMIEKALPIYNELNHYSIKI